MSAPENVLETKSKPSTSAASNTAKVNTVDGVGSVLNNVQLNTNKFMENFNPETSAREQRKLTRKLSAAGSKEVTGASAPRAKKSTGASASGSKKIPGASASGSKENAAALYDQDGRFLATGEDYCDCLTPDCGGCYYPCTKCGSEKCGIECRVNRTYVFDQVEFEGSNITYKNVH